MISNYNKCPEFKEFRTLFDQNDAPYDFFLYTKGTAFFVKIKEKFGYGIWENQFEFEELKQKHPFLKIHYSVREFFESLLWKIKGDEITVDHTDDKQIIVKFKTLKDFELPIKLIPNDNHYDIESKLHKYEEKLKSEIFDYVDKKFYHLEQKLNSSLDTLYDYINHLQIQIDSLPKSQSENLKNILDIKEDNQLFDFSPSILKMKEESNNIIIKAQNQIIEEHKNEEPKFVVDWANVLNNEIKAKNLQELPSSSNKNVITLSQNGSIYDPFYNLPKKNPPNNKSEKKIIYFYDYQFLSAKNCPFRFSNTSKTVHKIGEGWYGAKCGFSPKIHPRMGFSIKVNRTQHSKIIFGWGFNDSSPDMGYSNSPSFCLNLTNFQIKNYKIWKNNSQKNEKVKDKVFSAIIDTILLEISFYMNGKAIVENQKMHCKETDIDLLVPFVDLCHDGDNVTIINNLL